MKATNDSIKALLKTYKTESPLAGPVERMLLKQDQWADRRPDVIHPSELVYSDFCPRALYLRLTGETPRPAPTRLQREAIFAAGHEYHRKWQTWAWDAGILRGLFHCLACETTWFDDAPQACTNADCTSTGRRALVYREVPAKDPDLNISGHADGLLLPEPRLLEIKSIGEGTIRMDSPASLREHSHKVDIPGDRTRTVVDHRALFESIKHPLGNHVKQVTIYGRLLGVDKATLLYEYKATSALKEFNITLRFERVDKEFAAAAKVMAAVRGETPPPACAHAGSCVKCKEFDHVETDEDHATGAPDAGPPRGGRRRNRGGGPPAVPAPRGVPAADAGGGRPDARPPADGAVPGTRRLVRLRERPAD